VSESKRTLDPNDPAYYAPPRSRSGNNESASSARDRQALSISRGLEEHLANLRAAKSGNNLPAAQSEVFADALGKMLREQIGDGGDMPTVLKRASFSLLAAKVAVAVASGAVLALAYVIFFAAPPDTFSDLLSLVSRPFQSTNSSATIPSSPQRRASALAAHDSAGPVNEPLALGVSVDAEPGAIVTIKGMPPGARLTGGVPLSFTEWRVPADEISNVMVIPPADFVGAVDLTAELRDSDGAAQVTSFMQLVWKPAASAAVPTAANTVPVNAAPAPQPQPAAPQPQPSVQPQPAAPVVQTAPSQPPPPQTRPQTIAAVPTTTPAVTATPPIPAPAPAPPRVDAARELSPNEIAASVRRAQEMLANGDIKAARALLLRGAEARDARAALALAKTYDPIALRQVSSAESGPDLAQARNWYQKAREWGAPEAQRQLDALASYSR
jgi:hypothetical protein